MTDALRKTFTDLADQLEALVLGRSSLIERLLTALLADGHVLLEGPPGLAKTRAAYLLANAIDSTFQRIQFTPDLLPADLTGTTVYDAHEHRFDFHAGPLFHNVILADEINRAPAKVQAALLEAMEERQITVSGETRVLDDPFFVIATQNPIEEEGTYELPAAQLDRFMMRVIVDYPDNATERTILDLVQVESRAGGGHLAPLGGLSRVSADDLKAARRTVLDIHLSDPVKDYIVRLVGASRGHHANLERFTSQIAHAVSPRGTIALARLSQARAWLLGRDHVLPEDVQALAVDTLAHRLGLTYRAEAEGVVDRELVEALLDHVVVV
ncbi:MAG: MoxR family ATPase [Alphaproteobacteria bacterium]